MSNTVDVVTAALVPAQTIVSEAIIAVLKGLFGGHFNNVLKEGVYFIVIATILTLVVTLCVCNLLLSINKLQKVIGSTALITQAGITTLAQIKSINVEFKTQQINQANINDANSMLDNIIQEQPPQQENVNNINDAIQPPQQENVNNINDAIQPPQQGNVNNIHEI